MDGSLAKSNFEKANRFGEYLYKTTNRDITFCQKNMPYFRQKISYEISKGMLMPGNWKWAMTIHSNVMHPQPLKD